MRGVPKSISGDKYLTKTYRAFTAIKNRINNANYYAYHRYGGRGITVYWTSFEEFVSDVGLPPTLNHTIDRIDNDGNYTPENVKWSTWKEQARNRKSNRHISINGEKKTVAEWCELHGLNMFTFYSRINYGWGEEEAIKTPVAK